MISKKILQLLHAPGPPGSPAAPVGNASASPNAVVNGATLRCNHGTAPSPLCVSQSASIAGAPVAGTSDHLPGVNIFPFGTCKKLHKPCVPITTTDWANPATKLKILSTLEGVQKTSTLHCQVGGTIHVTGVGQGTVTVGSGLAALKASFLTNALQWLSSGDPKGFIADLKLTAGVTATTLPTSLLKGKLELDLKALEGKKVLTAAEKATLAGLKQSVKYLGRFVHIAGLSAYTLDFAQLVDHLVHGKLRDAAGDAGGIGGGLGAAGECETATGGGVEGGLWGVAGAQVLCGAVGVAGGILGKKAATALFDVLSSLGGNDYSGPVVLGIDDQRGPIYAPGTAPGPPQG